MTLKGIGEVLADRIIEYRLGNGNFTDIDELMEVWGIGQGIFDANKESITVR